MLLVHQLQQRWRRQTQHSNSKLPVLPVFTLSCLNRCFFLAKTLGAINRHRSGQGQARPPPSATRTTYINPSYKAPSSRAYIRSENQAASAAPSTSSRPSTTVRPPSGPGPSISQPHDVTIDGVVFESSKRSLVRKDRASIPFSAQPFAQHNFQSYPLPNPLHLVPVPVCNRNSAETN